MYYYIFSLRYYKFHRVGTDYVDNVLEKADKFYGNVFHNVYHNIGRYIIKLNISGIHEEVARYEELSIFNELDAIARKISMQEILDSLLVLTRPDNYVNEITRFVYRFEDFNQNLRLGINFGDGSPSCISDVFGSNRLQIGHKKETTSAQTWKTKRW